MSSPLQPPLPRPRRTWLTVLLCAVIFCAGGVVGAGGTLLRIGRQTREAIQHPEVLPHRVALRMQSHFNLSAEQTERVEQIVRRRQVKLIEVREALLRDVDPEIDALEQELGSVLTPEQARGFKERFRKLREEWLPRRLVSRAERPQR